MDCFPKRGKFQTLCPEKISRSQNWSSEARVDPNSHQPTHTIDTMRSLSKCQRLIAQTHTASLSQSKLSTPSPSSVRCLATISPPRRPQTTYTDNLNTGPTLSDFLSSNTEPTSIPGSSRLPDWLKRPIPAGGNFAKIKRDLRGLNLHTSTSPGRGSKE